MKVEVTITDDAGNIRQHVVSGMLPTDEEIINEAEGRYPVKTHNNPDNSPYVGTQKTFIHDVSGRSEQLKCAHQWRDSGGYFRCYKCGEYGNVTT